MKFANPELKNRLASEYVLGTMKGAARRRFESYLQNDAALRAEVSRWEQHLMPLVERTAPVEPPARVWARIEAAISAAPATTKPAGLWGSLAFWRGLTMAATGLAATVLIAVVMQKSAVSEPTLMAVLAEESNAPRVYIEQPKAGLLVVTMIKPWSVNAARSHELWVIAKNGEPRSLGVINSSSDTRIVRAELDTRLADGTQFAVSIEPPGGSTSGMPSRIVCKGIIAWMPKKAADRPQT